MSDRLPPREYYATLPNHLAGAGILLRRPGGRVLLVQPDYNDDATWEIPGGALDHGEYPWQAAAREVKEEIGHDLAPGRLLVVDIVPAQPDGRPPLINFLFDGGELTDDVAERLRPADDELKGLAWCTRDQWHQRLAPHLARRIDACVAAADSGITAYLQYGWPPEAGHH
ncbi:NUDIX domain-containing protein [Kitasatospora indigofera]|uniref:NUDIX domain-containing protein n=1 Tax=Kitasatospora indigofera TaxID=67307 RepID=UPI0036B95967